MIGESEILLSEFSVFGVWGKLFLLPLLMLVVRSTPGYLNALDKVLGINKYRIDMTMANFSWNM